MAMARGNIDRQPPLATCGHEGPLAVPGGVHGGVHGSVRGALRVQCGLVRACARRYTEAGRAYRSLVRPQKPA